MFNWLKKKEAITSLSSLTVDVHSHLLPGLDDGVQSFEQAAEMIAHFQRLGYTKLITTPHVMSDAYRNTSADILKKLEELNTYLHANKSRMVVEAAAEYYLDEQLYRMIENQEHLLTFGKNYLLFETNFLNEPLNLKEFIFLASTKGYKLVLAHPERYLYLQNNLTKAEDLLDRGVLFQLNSSSITGYYSKQVKTAAKQLIDRGWVHFVGSDGHHLQHLHLLEEAQTMKYYQKALSLPLLNNSL